MESGPTIIYQEVPGGESQSATSTIKALLELQQTTGEPLCHAERRGTLGESYLEKGLLISGVRP